jgi:hypothetical protein
MTINSFQTPVEDIQALRQFTICRKKEIITFNQRMMTFFTAVLYTYIDQKCDLTAHKLKV